MAVPVPTAPEAAPPAPRDTRRELAEEFLRGAGIEIGALHLRMAIPEGVLVRYVDRMTVADLRAHYPELRELDLAPVDVVDDGELLSTFAPESVDFIIANHFLEHCEDPIRTIETHLGKLRPGGVLFYAVPDKRYTFDFRRPRTPLAHVVEDHERGPETSRHEHYLEWQRLVAEPHLDPEDPELVARAAAQEADGYSIHFHVWTQADLVQLMLHCHERFGTFEIEAVRRRSLENIVVLRKHGTLADWSPPPPVAAPPAPPPAPPRARPSEALRSQITALLTRLGVHKLLEVGCGDFAWAQEIAPHVELYTGVDRDFDTILGDRIEHGGLRRRFLVRDVTRDPLPRADLVLCRNVLTRLGDDDVSRGLARIVRSGARYLLATAADGDADQPVGLHPTALRSPNAMPAPVEVLPSTADAGDRGDRLALWDLDDLRAFWWGPSSHVGMDGSNGTGPRVAEHEPTGDPHAD